MPRITFYDKAFIGVIFLFSMLGFYVNFTYDMGLERQYVSIYVDNNHVKEISFDQHTDREIPIRFGPGLEHTAVLEIKEGQVRMLPISEELCPRGICSHTGWISRGYQSIVCVPNRIVVHFSDISVEEVDGVTY